MMTVSELVTPHHCLRSASFKPIGSVLSKTLKRHTQSARMLDVFAARFYLCTAPLSLVPSAVVLADLGWSPLSTLQTSGHHPASTSKHLNKDFEEMLLSGASRAIYYLFTTYLKKPAWKAWGCEICLPLVTLPYLTFPYFPSGSLVLSFTWPALALLGLTGPYLTLLNLT